MKVRYAGLLSGASLFAVACASAAFAQTAPASNDIEEVVVTGSLIRDIVPPGGQTITVTAADVQATGVTTTNQLLANLPQLGGAFNGVPTSSPPGAANKIQVNILNLHGLDNANTSTGAGTLVLVDGHRIVSAGITQDTPDADVVPPGVIERVEILADGGSATYGADAVSGVINFITKSHVDGVNANVRYGVGSNYYSVDGNVTAGKDWITGSAYLSYTYSYNDAIFGRDRSYAKNLNWATGTPALTQCATPNITGASGTTYALPGLSPGTQNYCDSSKDATLFPDAVHHGLFGGFTQNLTNWLTFDVRGFYSRRTETNYGGYVSQTGGVSSSTVTPSNPYYQDLTGTPDAGKKQTVNFNFKPAFGDNFGRQDLNLNEWGVTPTFTADLGHTWQARAMFNYGQSVTRYYQQTIYAPLVAQDAAGTTTATALDPYDIANTDPALLKALANYQSIATGHSKLVNTRVVADGELFSLPAGAIHAAIGGELISNSFAVRSEANVVHGAPITDPFNYAKRQGALRGIGDSGVRRWVQASRDIFFRRIRLTAL
jgi:iron complex outermembrane receptor protein